MSLDWVAAKQQESNYSPGTRRPVAAVAAPLREHALARLPFQLKNTATLLGGGVFWLG